VLRNAALLLPGDRFIIRMFSPVITIGGGVVIDAAPPRYRKGDAAASRLEVLCSTSASRRIAAFVGESPHGLALAALVARTGMTAQAISAAAAEANLIALSPPYYLARPWFEAKVRDIERRVAEFHQANSLLPGIPLHDLRNAELPGAPPFVFSALVAASKQIAVEGEIARSAGRAVALGGDEERARAAIERAFEKGGLAAPTTAEALAQSGVDAAKARTLLQILLKEKKLVRVAADLTLHHTAVARLREVLAARRGARFQVPEFKEWTGVSRKYAIPLLEFLDREHVTRREGDARIVL
jgi:selenocysteine-specific elongation factor